MQKYFECKRIRACGAWFESIQQNVHWAFCSIITNTDPNGTPYTHSIIWTHTDIEQNERKKTKYKKHEQKQMKMICRKLRTGSAIVRTITIANVVNNDIRHFKTIKIMGHACTYVCLRERKSERTSVCASIKIKAIIIICTVLFLTNIQCVCVHFVIVSLHIFFAMCASLIYKYTLHLYMRRAHDRSLLEWNIFYWVCAHMQIWSTVCMCVMHILEIDKLFSFVVHCLFDGCS